MKTDPDENSKITWFVNRIMPVFGLIMIVFGLVFFVISIIHPGIFIKNNQRGANEVAIAFFIVMLGLAFAFPKLLQEQNGTISTMRIVVFMMANVICMLLLKIGWNVASLKDIGLNGNWMGVIAFLFGAKVAQKYFEKSKADKDEAEKQAALTKTENSAAAKSSK